MDVFCTVIDIISVCDSIPIEIPILWPHAVMVGPRPRVLLTLPLHIIQMCVAFRRGYVLRNASLGDFVVVRTYTYTNLDTNSIAYYTPRLYGIAYCF